MTWTITDDLDEYLARAGGFLETRPAEHTVLLSVAAVLRERGGTVYGDEPPRFGWWRDDGGKVSGAFLQTPPHPLLLTRLPQRAVAPLAKALDADGRPVPGVNAVDEVAEAFTAAWRQESGGGFGARVHQHQRLYRLAGLVPPDPAPQGGARVADESDRELLIDWYQAAAQEMGGIPGDIPSTVDDRVGHGGLMLWEFDGEPVSLAAVTRVLAGMARIGPVYTPAEYRRNGYASAVTAGATRMALDAGAREVLLFTDLANPTSNALYQRLGYRPIGDWTVLVFDAGESVTGSG